MSAVQCGDGQNIHKGKDDGEECRHVPELVPVPRGGENTADGSETSEVAWLLPWRKDISSAYVAFRVFTPKDTPAGKEERKLYSLRTTGSSLSVAVRAATPIS